MKAQEAIALVADATGADPLRPSTLGPIGCVINERGYVAGTDGHRVHAVRCDDFGNVTRTQPAAPIAQIVPNALVKVGEIVLCGIDLECANLIPNAWKSIVTLDEYGARLSCSLTKGKKKKERTLRMLDHAKVDWLHGFKLSLKKPVNCQLAYLRQAVEFCGGTVTVWLSPDLSEFDPLVFTPGDAARLPLDGERFAVVMPCRL